MRLYTYRWISLLVWLYVAEGAVRASSDRGLGAWLAGLEVVLALLIFVACAVRMCGCAPAPDAGAAAPMSALLEHLRAVVGAANVLADGDLSAWELDWRKRYRGRALAVVAARHPPPRSPRCVRLCAAHGMTHGAAGRQHRPGRRLGARRRAARQVLLSLARLNRVRGIDAANLTMTVEAGCVLQRVQEAAAGAGLLFSAEPRRRGQLHDRRQPRHQRRRHPGAALRQRARAVPGPRGGDGRRARSGTASPACARTTPATTCAT